MKRIYDDAFWAFLFKLVVYQAKQNTPDKIYDYLLPFLTGKPLEESLVAIKDDPAIDWRSPQRGSTAYYRCVLDSFYYLLRRKGLSVTKAKQAGFVLRAQMVTLIDNDLRFVPSLRYIPYPLTRLLLTFTNRSDWLFCALLTAVRTFA